MTSVDDGSLKTPPVELTTVLSRWDRRIRRESLSPSPRHPADFFDRWEGDIVEDGYTIGLSRLEIRRRITDLHATHQAPLVAYMNAYLAVTDWVYRKSCKMRKGRRGGARLDVLSELTARGHIVCTELVSLLENGHFAGAKAHWRSLFMS